MNNEDKENEMSDGSWATSGYGGIEDADKAYTGGGGGDGSKVLDFFVPPGMTKRLCFVDDMPFSYWEHSLYAITKQAKDNDVCLKLNKIHPRCTLCEVKIPNVKDPSKPHRCWNSYVGKYTVIDFGEVVRDPDTGEMLDLKGWENNQGRLYQFGRKLLTARKGSEEKPGMLKKIRQWRNIHGQNLVGTVWDCTRHGKKEETIGTDWQYVTRLPMEDLDTFLQALYQHVLETVGEEKCPISGPDDEVLKYTDVEPFDYSEIVVPKSIEKLDELYGQYTGDVPAAPSSGSQSNGGGGGYVADEDDEDIPF